MKCYYKLCFSKFAQNGYMGQVLSVIFFFGSGSASFRMQINYWCSYLFRYVKRWALLAFLTLPALSFACKDFMQFYSVILIY